MIHQPYSKVPPDHVKGVQAFLLNWAPIDVSKFPIMATILEQAGAPIVHVGALERQRSAARERSVASRPTAGGIVMKELPHC
jgi:hypothetical protein